MSEQDQGFEARMADVVRAILRVTINVTAEHIANGEAKNSGHCPIQLAIKDTLAEIGITAQKVRVDLQQIAFTVIEGELRARIVILTPGPAQRWLVLFDRGTSKEPFGFRLPGHYHATRLPPPKRRKSAASDAGAVGGDAAPQPTPKPRRASAAPAFVRSPGSKRPSVIGGRVPPVAGYSTRREYGVRIFGWEPEAAAPQVSPLVS